MDAFFHNRCIFTPDQQARAASVKTAVVGAGGLGGFVMNGLARLGVRHIKVVDFDVFTASNINRQLYAYEGTLGMGKAGVAAEMLRGIPGCLAEAVEERVSEENAERVFEDVQVVFDCVDNAQTKLVMEKYCLSKGIPLIHGGVDRSYGQAAIVLHKPVLSGILNNAFKPQNGVILPQLVSALQLELFIKYIKNDFVPDALYYIDTGAMELFQTGQTL